MIKQLVAATLILSLSGWAQPTLANDDEYAGDVSGSYNEQDELAQAFDRDLRRERWVCVARSRYSRNPDAKYFGVNQDRRRAEREAIRECDARNVHGPGTCYIQRCYTTR